MELSLGDVCRYLHHLLLLNLVAFTFRGRLLFQRDSSSEGSHCEKLGIMANPTLRLGRGSGFKHPMRNRGIDTYVKVVDKRGRMHTLLNTDC